MILLVYTWLRGLNWTPAHLMDMAIRRFSFVVKWAAVVMVASSLLIDLPRIGALLFRFDDPIFLNQTFAYIDGVGRAPAGAVADFVFHHANHADFPQRNLAQGPGAALPFPPAILVAAPLVSARGGHSPLCLALLNGWLLLGFGEETSAALAWNFVFPILSAFVAAWLLASWVSLFKRCETGRLQSPDWIGFNLPPMSEAPSPLLRAAGLFHHRAASPEVTLDLRGTALDFAPRAVSR